MIFDRNINIKESFNAIVGTGGIGTGSIYRLEGNHDLGRNESRMGHLLAVKDFCKLHIILHYIAVLIKDLKINTEIYPIGAVGDDPAAGELFHMMKDSGMNMKFVRTMENTPTLHSICYQYPDSSGGNITENQSASSKVSSQMMADAEAILCQNKSIVITAPEVPLSSRIALIKLGAKNHACVLASFVPDEIEHIINGSLLKKIDILSVNLDEAAALGNVSVKASTETIVHNCIKSTSRINPQIKLCITCGSNGLVGYDKGEVTHLSALNVPVKNTAGAGDAVLSGIITGLVLGLPFISDDAPSCVKLGRLISAMSVISPDTINFDMNLQSLLHFQKMHKETIL